MKACLLLHGFGGSPCEVSLQAQAMCEVGIHVITPALPGHNATIEEFRKTFFKDWYGAAEKYLLDLQKDFPTVIVSGFSMGGAIALLLASRHKVSAAASMSAPFFTPLQYALHEKSPAIFFAPFLQYIKPVLTVPASREESRKIAPVKGYEGVLCLPQLVSLLNGIAELRKEIKNCSCPLLLMHDVRDMHVPSYCALSIAKAASSTDVSFLFTRMKENITSHHMLVTHEETTEAVSKQLCAFALRI